MRATRLGWMAAVVAGLMLSTGMPVQAQQSERQYLSGRDAGSPARWDFCVSAGQQAGKWAKINVPGAWQTQGFGSYDYGHRKLELGGKNLNEQGLYRTTFRVPADWQAKRVFIVFDGVMTDAEVKVNGQSAGPAHQGAFYRFKYEITPLLKFGKLKQNTLEVLVREESANPSVNRAERNGDYWNFGGIFRPVWLEARPQQYVERVAIDARHDGALKLNYFLGGAGKADQVDVAIEGAQGKVVGSANAAAATTGTLAAQVAGPAAWTAETPNLYTALVRLKQGSQTVHELRQRFGFRTIEVKPRDGIYVNGQKVVLKGADRHSFRPETGRALSEKNHLEDINLMKDMNMNAVRMSHYPPDERFLELCDELGLYVLDELSGWQKSYTDTEHAKTLVRDMVCRDVNHPAILFWDNGNEGGWNNALNGEFAKWDPQQRNVLHPWELFGNVNTKHYPRYKDLIKLLDSGEIIMPTEFLHGLYDGGHGAGLEDYWNLMMKYPNLGGGFLWSLADEGVVRTDLNGAIDVQGNQAPDGIVGPHHEKEGSFYTIKEIWSPIHISRALPENFNPSAPVFEVENRYAFTNLKDCKFEWQLRKFGEKPGFKVMAQGSVQSPDVAPGKTAKFPLFAIASIIKPQEADALALKATDPHGRELWTWVWPLKSAKEIETMVGPSRNYRVLGQGNAGYANKNITSTFFAAPQDLGNQYSLKRGPLEVNVEKASGALRDVRITGKPFSLTSGAINKANWTMLEDGWLRVHFSYDTAAATSGTQAVGVAFNYPESKMKKKTWLGEGPYRVWRNRLLGNTFGVWETKYNATETGWKGFEYPEFAGYFAGVRWMKLQTSEGTLTIVNPDEQAFVRIGTPAQPEKKLRMKCNVDFPEGNVAVVRDLPPIGNKFHKAEETGPMAEKPRWSGPYQGTVYLKFER